MFLFGVDFIRVYLGEGRHLGYFLDAFFAFLFRFKLKAKDSVFF